METFLNGAFAGLFGYPQARLTISFCKAGGKDISVDPLLVGQVWVKLLVK